jgi:hypothetical protein
MNTPTPRRRYRVGSRPRVWRCGYCNARCTTVLAPGGLCALCRQQQPALFDTDATPGSGDWTEQRR